MSSSDPPIRTFETKGNTIAINLKSVTDLSPESISFPKPTGSNWNDRGILVKLSKEKVEGDNFLNFSSEEKNKIPKLFDSRYNLKEKKKVRLIKIPEKPYVWIKPLTEDSDPEEVKKILQEKGIFDKD